MKNILYTAILLLAILNTAGCSDDFLDTKPSSSVSEKTIYESLNNLYIALNGIHKEMVSQETGTQCLGGEPGFMITRDASGDDMTWTGNSWLKSAYLGWNANSSTTSGYNYKIWRIYYQWIINANKILVGLEKLDPKAIEQNPELANQIKGETLCIRAWAHFNLVQLYGDRYQNGKENTQPGIPYRLTPEIKSQERDNVETVYQLINKDLDEACTLLKDIKPKDVNHYSEMVAWGLKARVALTMQDYSKAATYANKSRTIAETNFNRALMEGEQLYHGFANITSETKEAMYAAMTPDDKTVYFYSFYAFMSWNFSASAIRGGVKCINADTYNTISNTDLRRQWWDPTGEKPVPNDSFKKAKYQNRKFTARSTADAVGDVAFMRLAEMYLIEAEALARSGNEDEAQTVFTTFQQTRDPEYVSQGNSGQDLIEEIMNSRRVELWGEGFRFFDLKRLHIALVRGSNFDISFCTFLEKSADDEDWTYVIPKKETDYN